MAEKRIRAAHRPVDALTRANIQDAARPGNRSRNSIAREYSVSGETVTRICAEVGLTFDRAQTEAAVRAHELDLAKERLQLVREMVAEAREQLDIILAPYMVYEFGGMDGGIHSWLLDSAPMDVRNTVMRSAALAFDKAQKALDNTPEGVAHAESLLDRIAADLSRFDDDVDDELAE